MFIYDSLTGGGWARAHFCARGGVFWSPSDDASAEERGLGRVHAPCADRRKCARDDASAEERAHGRVHAPRADRRDEARSTATLERVAPPPKVTLK